MTTTANMCVADGGLINPELFPAKAADLDTSKITGAASDLRSMGGTVKSEVDAIESTWSGLSGHYEAPEQQQVYDLMDPAVTSAGELKSAFRSMATHLDTYASTLDGIKPRLQSFEDRAAAFRADVINGVEVDASEASDASFGDQVIGLGDWIPGVDERKVTVPWYEDGGTVDRNKALLDEYGALLEEVTAAAATCANDINRLVTNMCIAPAAAIPAEAFTNPEQPMPWGTARDEDRNCMESTGHGISNFGYGIYSGGAMLIGYDTEAGDWGWDNAGQAWGGMADFVGSTLVLMTFTPHLAQMGVPLPGSEWLIERGNTATAAWTSLVGYDFNAALAGGDGWHRWKEDGVATGVESVLNIGTFFIPGAGAVGGAAKTGVTGSRLARLASAAADFAVPGGSWVLRGGARVTPALRTFFSFGDNVPNPAALAGRAPGMNPAALLDVVDDVPVHVTPQTPVSSQLFDTPTVHAPAVPDVPGAGRLPEAPSTTMPEAPSTRVPEAPSTSGLPDRPGTGGAPETPGTSSVPETPGRGGTPDGSGDRPVNQAGDGVADPAADVRPGPADDGQASPAVERPTDPAGGAANRYDPDATPRQTVSQSEAPSRYRPEDPEVAYRNAPVDEHGRPVDHRTGEPLRADAPNGDRQWHMRWDPEGQAWVAENPGSGLESSGLPATGEPGAFGYDTDGNLMPYANSRPSYADGQVMDVWNDAMDSDGQVWVEGPDGDPVQIEWEPGTPRTDVWDMGHLPGREYRDLRYRYLNHEITKEQFLAAFQKADNYQVEHPAVNRSHRNEEP